MRSAKASACNKKQITESERIRAKVESEAKNNNGKKSQIILVITFWGSTKQRRGKKDVKTFDPRLEAAAFLSSTRERFSFYCFWFFASNFNFRFIAFAQRETLQWGVALDVNGSRVGRKFPAQNINQSRGINSNVYMFRCHFVRDSCIKRQHA